MKLLIKEIKIRTLVSGDKQAQVLLETLYPSDIKKIASLSESQEIKVEFKDEEKETFNIA